MAARTFNRKQALEKEIKELYVKGTFQNSTAAAAVADLTEDITYTSVAAGPSRNTNTITIQVLAAAANPTDTVLAAFTGTAAAITITITPNDGTNNTATPVDLTTEELVELINSGAVVGKTVTVTDASSLRALQTATGGDSTPLADGGEGDGVVATFTGGDMSISFSAKYGVASITRSAVGTWDVVLEDKYYALKSMKAIIVKSTAEDLRFQLKSETVTSKAISFLTLTGASATDPSTGLQFMMRFDLKNTLQV
ncbi:MAG: hypothetical protein ACAH17_00115 [Candidatus Paceibacterota bacterium]